MGNIHKIGGGHQTWGNQPTENVNKAKKAENTKPVIDIKDIAGPIYAPIDHVPKFITDKIDDVISKVKIFGDSDPKGTIDDLRSAQGNERYQLLMDFQGKLDKMSNKDLKVARDYLVSLISQPNNKDDQYLGLLLKSVNQEMDSRKFGPIGPLPRPMPFDPMPPAPKPIKPWIFDPNIRVD